MARCLAGRFQCVIETVEFVGFINLMVDGVFKNLEIVAWFTK